MGTEAPKVKYLPVAAFFCFERAKEIKTDDKGNVLGVFDVGEISLGVTMQIKGVSE